MGLKPNLAIIGGGGCRQIECATGIFQALEAQGVTIDKYAGSSAGAAMAALHASGINGVRFEQLIRMTPARKLFKFCWIHQLKSLIGLNVDHLYDASGMYDVLEKNMCDVRDRVRVAITRLADFRSMMCDATPATVMASAAIPEVFQPVRIGDDWFVDGGVKNMIPTPKIAEIKEYDHIYILICNDNLADYKSKTRVGRALQMFLKTMEREVSQIYESGWHELDNVTVIHPPPFDSGLLNWSKDYQLIEHARKYAQKVLKGKR